MSISTLNGYIVGVGYNLEWDAVRFGHFTQKQHDSASFSIRAIGTWQPSGEYHAVYGLYKTYEEALNISRANTYLGLSRAIYEKKATEFGNFYWMQKEMHILKFDAIGGVVLDKYKELTDTRKYSFSAISKMVRDFFMEPEENDRLKEEYNLNHLITKEGKLL